MSKYDLLVKILDKLCKEAPRESVSYHPDPNNIEQICASRSKALIHLFLKVKYRLLSFEDRIPYITDGSGDGGIDAYFIDYTEYKIYFIQSKFRNNEHNYENKDITLSELITMDIDRIMKGEDSYENGTRYNSHIKRFQGELKQLTNIAKFKREVIFLANIDPRLSDSKIQLFTDGCRIHRFNFERIYNEFVFPVVSGNYFYEPEINISIPLINIQEGSVAKYVVNTAYGECSIRLLFVPTLEIAKLMSKYRNSILKYNPRSYLDISKNNVNNEIKQTLELNDTNEFAIFNNGITLLVEKADFTDRTASKGVGKLTLVNPQIINGGQTAFTLSRIYEELIEQMIGLEVFSGKEVLLKVVELCGDKSDNPVLNRNGLIEAISRATNRQTEVISPDRRSNDIELIQLQEQLFRKFGVFFERKVGEFGDGIKSEYIHKRSIIKKGDYIQATAMALHRTSVKSSRLWADAPYKDIISNILENKNYFCYLCLQQIDGRIKDDRVADKHMLKTGPVIREIVYLCGLIYSDNYLINIEEKSKLTSKIFIREWSNFLTSVQEKPKNRQYLNATYSSITKQVVNNFSFNKYFLKKNFESDLYEYFHKMLLDHV